MIRLFLSSFFVSSSHRYLLNRQHVTKDCHRTESTIERARSSIFHIIMFSSTSSREASTTGFFVSWGVAIDNSEDSIRSKKSASSIFVFYFLRFSLPRVRAWDYRSCSNQRGYVHNRRYVLRKYARNRFRNADANWILQ